MTGTELFVLIVVSLCILYLLTYFAFFRRHNEIKDGASIVARASSSETTTTTTTTTTPSITPRTTTTNAKNSGSAQINTNEIPKFVDRNAKGSADIDSDDAMIVDDAIDKYNVDINDDDDDDGDDADTEMLDVSSAAKATDNVHATNTTASAANNAGADTTAAAITSNDVTNDVSKISNTMTIVTLPDEENTTKTQVNLAKRTINHEMLNKTKNVLDCFVNIEKRQAEYDDVPFVYPNIMKKINSHGKLDDPLCSGETNLNLWNKDSKVLRNVVHSMMLSMAIDLDNARPYNIGILIFIQKFMNEFVKNYRKTGRPWGKDDLGFIDMMHLLAMFMISPNTTDIQRYSCAKIIVRVITRPGFSFNEHLAMTNIAHTSTPYILAKLLLNMKITKLDSKRIKKAIFREYSEVPSAGFHHDHSFTVAGAFNVDTPNALCSKYKYELLTVLLRDLVGMDTSLTFTSATNDLNTIIIHPTIKLGVYGINTYNMNNPKLTSTMVYRVPKDNYGLAVMPLARVLRLFTKHHCFAVRGVVNGVSYMPESTTKPIEQTLPRNQFYAMQMRKPLSDREPRIKYPNFGCLVWAIDNELSSMDPVLIQQAASFVGMYDNVGVFHQTYTLYDAIETTSTYFAEELIIIRDNASEQTLDFNIKVINSSDKRDLTYYGYDNEKLTNNNIEQYYSYGTSLTVPCRGGIKTFNTKLRIRSDTGALEMMEPTREISSAAMKFPIVLNDHAQVEKYGDSNDYAVIKLPNEPQVYCPSESLSVTRSDFSYDVTTNQWVSNKNVRKRRQAAKRRN